MKPLRLKMQAFGSYGKETTIDFEKVNQNLFLITGDTGAGKTTIFDAIVFALYGEASSSLNKKEGVVLQSQYVDFDSEPYVELVFSEGRDEKREIYTVRRVPRHLKTITRGANKGKPKENTGSVSLIMPDGMEYPSKETDRKLQEIVGLTKSQFMQVAMIAQGEFMDLLRAKSDDKNCYIAYNLKKEKGEVTAEYEVSDGEFKLRQKSNHVTVNMDLSGIEALISGTKDYTQRNQFILYLPEAKQISSAELDMADGDISVDRLRSDRIDISVDAGDIKLLDTESKEIKIASSDGDMAVKNSKLNTVTINDSYGDIKFEDADIDSGKISTNDGDISVKNTNLKGINITDNYGDIKCNDGSFEDIAVKLNDGDLRLGDTKFDGNIKIKSGYGDVKVIGFDDWKGISVNAKTSYGDVSVKNITGGDKTETSFERNIESATATVEIKCSDGDISIR